MTDESQKPARQLAQFDADLPPSNVQNRQAAKEHGLRYDRRTKRYYDEDGCPTRDRYGQELG